MDQHPPRSATTRTATTRVVTQINRTAILDVLHERGSLSRKQIGVHTGLSSASVERLCAGLLREGLIAQDGLERSSGGRPSSLLRYAGESRVVAVVEVSTEGARGFLVDLDGTRRAERTVAFGSAARGRATRRPDATDRLDGTVELVELLVDQARETGTPCIGIGISVPGIVHDGRVVNTVELGWREVPLGAIVLARTGIPTHVENDANAVAYGEWARGAGAGAHSVAAYVLGVGVGCGIVDDGVIHRGFRSAAGEVGYLLTETSALRRFFADQGDLESRIAGVAEEHARSTPPRVPTVAAMHALLDAAAAGEESAAAAAHDLFDLVAFSCGAIATVLDPEVIVLGGHLSRQPQYAIDEITTRLVGRIPFPPRLMADSLGADGALIGVGEIVARRVRGSTYLA